MKKLDGSTGEGGGQILRTSLALSAATGIPFTIGNIRSGRKKPGLMRQHLTAVNAAAEICGAEVAGAEIGSQEVSFIPGDIVVKDHTFSVGTAGSSTLVLQTVLPPFLTRGGSFRLTLEGGTHNPMAPTVDFLEKTFFGALKLMGVESAVCLERAGFFPAGGGRFTVEVRSPEQLAHVELLERGEIISWRARALISKISESVGTRELAELQQLLPLSAADCEVEVISHSRGPGNAMVVEATTDTHTAVFSGVGRREMSAEKVAQELAAEVKHFLQHDVPVDEHLADQLLIPMALAGGGAFRTSPLSRHSTTNMETIQEFLDVAFEIEKEDTRAVLVRVHS